MSRVVPDNETVDALVGLTYEAADDPERWPDVLERVGRFTSSAKGVVYLVDRTDPGPEGPNVVWMNRWNIDESAWDTLRASTPNPYTENRHLAPPDGAVIGSMLVPLEEYRTSEFYRKAASRLDMVHKLAVIVANTETEWGSFSVFRAEKEPDYDQCDLILMRRLGRHLRRSARIAARLAQLENRVEMLVDGVNGLSVGLVLVDSRGRSLFANAIAENVLRDDAIPALGGGWNCVRSVHNGLGLDDAIARAVGRRGPRVGSAAVVERRAGRRPVAVSVVPLAGESGRFGALAPRAAAAIVFRDPKAESRLEVTHLRSIWGLTGAEARLALDLLGGMPPLEHARRRGISENTLRTHLKNVKSKLGVSKITDVIALLAAHSL